jgi:hypothetical protein
MNRMITWVAVATWLALGACSKKSENPPPAPSASPVSAGSAAPAGSNTAMAAGSGATPGSASAGSAAAPAAADVDVPTAMDFEDDATAKITDKNVEAQVQAMEKELQQ